MYGQEGGYDMQQKQYGENLAGKASRTLKMVLFYMAMSVDFMGRCLENKYLIIGKCITFRVNIYIEAQCGTACLPMGDCHTKLIAQNYCGQLWV